MKKVVTVPSVTASLSSNNNTYKIRLNKDVEHERIIPRLHNITKTYVSIPNDVDEIRFIVGNQNIVTFDRHTLQYLETFPLYMSLIQYMYVDIEFVYNKGYLSEHEEFVMVDEYKEQESYGTDEVEIFDGYYYYVGHVVTRSHVPTGKKIRQVTNGVTIRIPEIKFEIEPGEEYSAYFQVPLQQRVDLKTCDDNCKKRFKENYSLRVIDDNIGYVTNFMMYINGVVGLKYSF